MYNNTNDRSITKVRLFNKYKFACFITGVVGMSLIMSSISLPLFVNAANGSQVNSGNAGSTSRVAPGELLPVSVKLSNFGGGKRVDVLVKYLIINSSDSEVYSTSDTVAVETTASFVKYVQIPSSTEAGTYTAKTEIVYQGQLTPASSQFSFTVEPKILGVFQSDFFLYGGIALLVSIALVIFGRLLIKRIRPTRYPTLDYGNIPKNDRIFYEILSDTITQMREHVGDDALVIAASIKGLNIDARTGRVITITDNPSKVIATLVSEYEKQLGKKVSFLFREGNKE